MGFESFATAGLVGAGLGTAIGVPMVWPQPHGAEIRRLGGALLLVSAMAALISARMTGLVPAWVATDHAVNVAGLLALPLVVAYILRGVEADDAIAMRMGALAVAAYAVAATARGVVLGDSRVPFPWILPVVFGWTGLAAVAVVRRTAPRPDLVVPPEAVLAMMVVLNLAQIARMAFGHLPAGRAAVPLAALLAFVTLSTWITWRAARRTRPDATAARYVRPAIDDGDARALLENIERAFAGQRLFADPGLTLAALAAAVDATPHQVSEALNRVAGVSFRDLLNRRRIDDVKRQLAAADGDRYTVEGIGASAGFRSRSALHATFHRLEGMTPAAYRTLMRRPPE